ncbi:hypothetical protein AB3N58_17565 (plasmid) [Leptospira sp. WS60.C2]
MKIWNEKPLKSEVKKVVKEFFKLLKAGELERAKHIIAHQYEDWDSQLYSLWQDTYLIYLEYRDREVEDDSFEGQLWRKDLRWLKKLQLVDVFKWGNEEGEYVEENDWFNVPINYAGETTDVTAEFRVDKKDGHYFIVRETMNVL